jgi:CoA-dependent NAD(P)H sulfur oxidoreductase
MNKKLNVVILGGSAAGPTAASTAQRHDPEANIILLEKGNFISYGA